MTACTDNYAGKHPSVEDELSGASICSKGKPRLRPAYAYWRRRDAIFTNFGRGIWQTGHERHRRTTTRGAELVGIGPGLYVPRGLAKLASSRCRRSMHFALRDQNKLCQQAELLRQLSKLPSRRCFWLRAKSMLLAKKFSQANHVELN